jgi:hypothetical protein
MMAGAHNVLSLARQASKHVPDLCITDALSRLVFKSVAINDLGTVGSDKKLKGMRLML